MSTSRKAFYLFAVIASFIILPYAGGWIVYDGNFPKDYFDFPALSVPEKSPFSITIFIITTLIFSTALSVYIFPKLYGFKVPQLPPKKTGKRISLPSWFWLGLVMWAGTLFVLWGKFSGPKFILNWAAIPLFWGFTLMLDGWAYIRNEGKSIISHSFREMVAMGLASISGWLIFEFLNFFVLDNWSYPAGDLLPNDEFVIYAVLGSSGLLPMSFEWYYLLKTSRFFGNRFKDGPRLKLSDKAGTVILIVSLVSLFLISFLPDLLFGFLWIAPLCVLSVTLIKLKIWTPFENIKKGDWTMVLLFNISYLIQGVFVECWNYFSAYHNADGSLKTYNPDYWEYSVPYVNVLHVFEMPVLGFLGYMPFGIYCVIWWICFTFLLNINRSFPDTVPGN